MKKILLLFIFSFIFSAVYSQKNKTPQKITSSVLAKSDNVSVEISRNTLFILINNKGIKKDTILLKAINENSLPSECKIVSFTSKGTKLYNVTWLEKNLTETKLKTEDATLTYSEICDIASKSKVLSNVQTTTKIKEIHFLDAKQTVSETIQKVRNEGFVLIITKNGDIVLKNKTQENKMTFNATDKKFVNVSSSTQPKKK